MIKAKSNLFTYIYLTIFIVLMSYTLFSGILYMGITAKYPFLWYGGIIVAMGTLWLTASALTSLLSRFDLHLFEQRNNKYSIIESIIVIAILILGAGLRVWVIKNLPIEPASDFKTYYDIAALLSKGDLIKDGVGLCDYISQFPHVIGYPYVLSKIFNVFGVSVSVGLYFNLAVSLINILLSYRIARIICGKVGGLIALVLVAFWPSQILYINHLASEPVFTCLALFSIWIAVYLFKYPSQKGKPSAFLFLNIVLGVSLALGAAIRPMSIILLIAIIICILPFKIYEYKDSNGLIRKGMSKGWIRALVIIISYLLCSQIISGAIAKTIDRELPSISVSFGYNLLVGLNTDSKGAWNEQDAKLMSDKFLGTDSAIEAHKAARDVAFKRIQKDPSAILNLAFEKYTLLWANDNYASTWNLLFLEQQNNLTPERKTFLNNIIPWNNLYYLLCVFLSLLAGISLWYRKIVGPEHILILFFIGTAILHMLLESQNRYHYNIMPIFAILAAYGCIEYFQRYANKTSNSKEYASLAIQQGAKLTQDELSAANEIEIIKDDMLTIKAKTTQEQLSEKTEQQTTENNYKFDMLSAIKEGHVIVTVTEAYSKNTKSDETLKS